MGGLIVLRTLFLHPDLPLRSAAVSAPLLGVKVKLNPIKILGAHVLARIWGSLHMNSEIDPGLLSHDTAVGEAYLADRLVHTKGTPRFYVEMQKAIADTLTRESGIEVPLQMLIPTEDSIVDSNRALTFFQKLKHREKELRTYEGFYHEIFNEIGKERVFQDLAAWIRTHD